MKIKKKTKNKGNNKKQKLDKSYNEAINMFYIVARNKKKRTDNDCLSDVKLILHYIVYTFSLKIFIFI